MTQRARLVLELLKENHSVDEIQSILKLNNREFSDALKYLKDYGFNFTKTFYSDGKKHDTQFVEYGNTPSSVSNPKKDGYVFKYWSKTEGGSEVKIGYYTVTSNVDFYAVFEEEEEEAVYYTVTFYVDGNEYSSSKIHGRR